MLTYVKFGGIATAILFIFFSGCQTQKQRMQEQIEIKETRIVHLEGRLRMAAASLRAAGVAITLVNTAAQRNIERAEKAKAEAKEAAEAARKDKQVTERAVKELEDTLKEEATKCADGAKPICGIPLR